MRISDWSSDVCSSDLRPCQVVEAPQPRTQFPAHAPSPPDPRYPAQGGSRRGAVSGLCRCAVAGRPTLRPGNIVVLADFSSHNSKRSEEHTSELTSLMRHSYAVFCLKKK